MGPIRRRGSIRSVRVLALVTVMISTAVACSSGPNSTISPPVATASTVAGSPPVTAVTWSPSTASDLATPSTPASGSSASPSATPSPTPQPGPTLSPLPAGAWTGLRWLTGPQIFPCDPTQDSCGDVSLFSWSQGYLLFTADPDSGSSMPWFSADGLKWRQGKAMDMSGVEGSEIVQVDEGPKGLLAVARSGATGLCGTYPIWIQGLWTSSDGLSWSKVNLRTAFAGAAVYDVSGGPKGYVADGVANDGMTTAAWVSDDGRAWRATTLPDAAMSAAEVDNATAFGNGYVLTAENFGGCGPIPLHTASVWWSADGAGWVQGDLPGSTATLDIGASVFPAGGQGLLAVCSTSADHGKTVKHSYWTSNDGEAWKTVTGPALKGDGLAVLSYKARALVVSYFYDDTPDSPIPPTILTFNSGGSLTALKQAGTAPHFLPDQGGGFGYVPTPNAALGPSGLLVTDGVSIWIGVPTAG